MAKAPSTSRTKAPSTRRSSKKAAATAAAPAADAPFDAGDGVMEADATDAGPGGGSGKQLVIVESPAKAKTINKYLGPGYQVLASVGHVRDLPNRNPKGVKSPVPGVDLQHDFSPTYVVMEDKGRVMGDLRKAAKRASEIWFATDPDREGEAIAWHIASELGVDPLRAKRVMFNAITKDEIKRAFNNPHPINMDRVNAQQARRIVDRIVGYQVSPLLWKKVARGLSAGRVQSVAVRLIVEREREIRAFVPDESWAINGVFTAQLAQAAGMAQGFKSLLAQRNEKGDGPTVKEVTAWLAENGGFRAELAEVAGQKFDLSLPADGAEKDLEKAGEALAQRAVQIAQAAGLNNVRVTTKPDPKGKGPARFVRSLTGEIDPSTPYAVSGIETRRTTSRPSAPFITSTLQQAGSVQLGFTAKRTMAAAQQLYQGVDIPGEGPVALITYMRTDSTHLSREAIEMVREYIPKALGPAYLPDKPNFYTSSNKDAQEAHEAIRPTSLNYPPSRLRSILKPDLLRVYELIWKRFVACQCTPAQWDATTVSITGGKDPARPLTFRASGRVLVFDGFLKVTGVPQSADEQTLPTLAEKQKVAPFGMAPRQKFSSPPPRYTEAGLIKSLEEEGIGRPSTYASIISVIQDRKYVELLERRFYATSLGEAVTDKLIEAFPQIMDLGYTREMEADLDKIEEEHLDWVQMLHRFYGPFAQRLSQVENTLTHAKAETVPAPDEFRCAKCGAPTVYRLGKNGRFLSCSTYPACDYAAPVDRDGVPRAIEATEVACPKCKSPMSKRTGRFGAFLGCTRYNDKQNPCDGIVRLDKKGFAIAPSAKPFTPEPPQPCTKCSAPMYLRPGKYGPWLGCSKFPKCRGRGDFKKLPEDEKTKLLVALEAHQKTNPVVIVKTLDGQPLTGTDGKPLPGVKPPGSTGDESLEAVADELGV